MVKFIQFEFAILGLGILIVWSALVSTLDWLNLAYPDGNVSFIFPVTIFLPYIIFQPLTIWKGSEFSFNIRIIPSFIIGCLFLISTYLFATQLEDYTGYILTLISILILSTFDSISETSLYGLSGMLSEEYAHALLVGTSFAGVSLSLLRIVCLASFSNDKDGLMISTLIYYTISATYRLICIPVQLHIMRNTQVQERLDQLKQDAEPSNDPEGLEDNQSSSDYLALLAYIWKDLLIIWFISTTSSSLFPGLSLATSSKELSYSWFSTLMVLLFNIGDLIGRYIPRYFLISTR